MADEPSTRLGRTGKAIRADMIGNANSITHGHTVGKDIPPEYNSWKGMRQRCQNPTNPRFPLYGGRGIRVCDRWQEFPNFLSDMGRKPGAGYSIDRIDVNGDYEPGNCRWADQKSQCRNQRRNHEVSFNGDVMTIAALSEHVGIESSHLRYHLKQGRSPEDAVAIIIGNRNTEAGKCRKGHDMTGDNIYLDPRGRNQCRTCRKQAAERNRAKAKGISA